MAALCLCFEICSCLESQPRLTAGFCLALIICPESCFFYNLNYNPSLKVRSYNVLVFQLKNLFWIMPHLQEQAQ
jgi:hypothetical protein